MWALYVLGGLIVLFGLACFTLAMLGGVDECVEHPHDEHEEGLPL